MNPTQSKPLLLNFFAIWCPPCNTLEHEVFSSPEFKKSVERFQFLKLDGDSDAAWELKSKYKIGGYPTLLFATAAGEEISRVVGYTTKQDILNQIDKAYTLKDSPLSALKEGERLGAMYLERRDYKNALKHLAQITPKKEIYWDARLGLLEEADSKEQGTELSEALLEAIREFPKSPSSLDRRARLAELYQERGLKQKRAAVLEELISTANQLLESPALLDPAGYSPADIYSYLAEALESLNRSDESTRAWNQAANYLAKNITSDTERGRNLERAHCLWKAGRISEAKKLYGKLQAAYPGEFTFFFAEAARSFESQLLSRAEELSRKALAQSYGDNKLRTTLLLAKILKAQTRTSEAQALIATAIKEFNRLPADPEVRTHKHIKALKDFR